MALEIELGPEPIKLRRGSPGSADNDVLVLPFTGPQGPTGPAGGDPYIHTQSSPSASWIIIHNLGRIAHTVVLNSSNEELLADIVHSSINQLTVTFASPQTGAAYLV